MDQQVPKTHIARIVRHIFEAFAGDRDGPIIDLSRYTEPILQLFADEGAPLTLEEAIYRADRWTDICQDIGHYLREIRDAAAATNADRPTH